MTWYEVLGNVGLALWALPLLLGLVICLYEARAWVRKRLADRRACSLERVFALPARDPRIVAFDRALKTDAWS